MKNKFDKPKSVITAHAETLVHYNRANGGNGVQWFGGTSVYCDPIQGISVAEVLQFNDDNANVRLVEYRPGRIIIVCPAYSLDYHPRLTTYINKLLPDGVSIRRVDGNYILRWNKLRTAKYSPGLILWGKPVKVMVQ